ncbi:inositol monophosphatase family protein [Luteococcus sp. Sow4_B9]|uniref:inositol monophosphatase family protein n=1 Tax=Luteococcus sp. Sow4_B9 TaxID=3438792 RepID=UPI003F99CFEC
MSNRHQNPTPSDHGRAHSATIDLQALEHVALEVAQACARLVTEERPEALDVAATKSSATDVVTIMDRRCEELASQMLTELRPDDGQFGEEGLRNTVQEGVTWVVDPIDGTVNYLYGIPSFCVSVAAVLGDPAVDGAWEPLAGAVVAPLLGEAFSAHRGGGARQWRDDHATELRFTPAQTLDQSLVATGFGYESSVRAQQAEVLTRVLPQVRDIRRAGAAALDICHVASGQLDAYYERGVHVWDIAAATLICTEAGAVVRGLDHEYPDGTTIVASVRTAEQIARLVHGS